jgi:hypothetical protein
MLCVLFFIIFFTLNFLASRIIVYKKKGMLFVLAAMYWCLCMMVQHVLDMQVWAFKKKKGECIDFEHLF